MDSYQKNTAVLVLAVMAVAALGTSFYFYQEYSSLKKNPNKVAQDEVKNLVLLVGQLMVLPENETPTLATVSNPDQLKDQPFFAKAKKGDKVLLYTNARKAILYDPLANKIVEVAPINIGPQATPSPVEEE